MDITITIQSSNVCPLELQTLMVIDLMFYSYMQKEIKHHGYICGAFKIYIEVLSTS